MDKKKLLYWITGGFLIRLIFMPFTASPDLLWFYWRAHFIVYHKVFVLNVFQLLTHYIHAFFLLLFTPLMPYHEQIWWHELINTHPLTPEQIQIMMETFRNFVSHPHIFRTLFLLKLPYLLFDFGCLFLIILILKTETDRDNSTAIKFWLFNPVSIFVVYIYGRGEVIPLFFLIASIYLVKKERLFSAFLMLGISIATRLYPLMLLPFYLILLGKDRICRIKYLIPALLPITLMAILSYLAGTMNELEWLPHISQIDYLLSMNFHLGLEDRVYLFVTGYVVMLLYCIYFAQHTLDSLIKILLVFHLFLFATCYFHRQFFLWTAPFLALYLPKERGLIKLYIGIVICYFVYTMQGRAITAGNLLAPLNPDFYMSLPSPAELIDRVYPSSKFIGIFRSILSALSFWMIFLIYRKTNLSDQNQN